MADMEDSVIQETPIVELPFAMVLDPKLNSYTALSHAPHIITSLGHLLLISAENDFSLGEQLENAKFKYINHPDSFRACVVQVSKDVSRAFDAAHNSMYRISMKSTSIGKGVKKAVEFIENGSKDKLEIVYSSLKYIADQCTECVDIAASITKDFENVADTMDELMVACAQSKRKCQEEQNETSRKKEAAVSKQEQIKKNQEMLKARCEREKSEYEEAKKMFDKAFESHPSTWKIMLFGVAGVAHDVAIAVLPSILLGISMPTAVVSAGQPTEPSSSQPERTNDKANVIHKRMLEENEKKRKEAKEFLLECYTRYERSQDKMLQESMEMKKVFEDLATSGDRTLDLAKMKDALYQNTNMLNKVIEYWNKFQNLFHGLHIVIGERLKADVKLFSDTTTTANEGIRDGQQIAEITHQTLIQESREAQEISLVVRNISNFYVSVSEKYLLEGVTRLHYIATLDPETDRARMEEMREELVEDGRKAELGILKIAQDKEKELRKRMENL